MARFATLDGLGLRRSAVAAIDGRLYSTNNGLPDQAGIALAGFHRFNGDFVVRTALDVTDEPDVYENGYWMAPKYVGQGIATEAANAAIRYAFGHLGAKAISIGYFEGNEPSRRIVEKLGFQKIGVARSSRDTLSRRLEARPS